MMTDADQHEERRKRLEELLAGKRAALFDFDGTIADSEVVHFLSYKEVFQRRYGHTLIPEEYWIHWTSGERGSRAR